MTQTPKFVVSLADNLYSLPTQFLECESLRDLLDVFTDYGTETISDQKDMQPLAFAANFDLKDGKKSKAHITSMNPFMALDLDDTTPAGFDRALVMLRAQGGVAWYTSHSWTPESPCVRFLVLLDRTPTPEEYERCWRGFQALLGGQVDGNTKDFSRGYYVWGRPADRAPGRFALYEGPAFSVDSLLDLAARTAVSKKPLSEGKFVMGEKEWKAVAKKCAKSKKESAQKAMEFLEPALERNAWGGPGNRNEPMMRAMLYAAATFGERGIDVERSVEFFQPAVDAVKREDPQAGTTVAELARTLRDRLSFVSSNRQEADRFAPLLTDDGCAKSIVAANSGKLRYIHSRKLWRAWDGKRWGDESAKVQLHNAIVAFSDKLLTDAAKLGDEGDALRAQGYRLQSAGGIKAMKELLQDQEKLVAVDGDFDKDPMLLNVENGILDLRTGLLGPHAPERMLTKLATVRFDASAGCPRWDRFMDEVSLGRADLAEYIHRIMGYCMTGDVSEHKFWLFTGDGRNGKGTLINTVFRMLGKDYAVKCASDMFTEKYVQKHAQETMALEGKRLAYASEVPKGAKWDLARLKSLTGGDIQSGNRMRENNTQFDPTHKLIILANDAPGWDADDKAFARRMKRVPFELEVPEGKEDRGLEAALLSEASGILNRLVAAVQRWLQVGFGPEHEPECVRKTTQAYREENDPLAAFLEEKCELDIQARANRGDVWTAWTVFCAANGLQKEMGTQISLGKRLSKRFQPVKGAGGVRQWQGFALKGQVQSHKPN